jgi:hypothetical protein
VYGYCATSKHSSFFFFIIPEQLVGFVYIWLLLYDHRHRRVLEREHV